jgi:hypothetical protein
MFSDGKKSTALFPRQSQQNLITIFCESYSQITLRTKSGVFREMVKRGYLLVITTLRQQKQSPFSPSFQPLVVASNLP